jgi:GTP pyrophosphokinase
VLKTGDQVEIITAETEKPKREWLQFVKTSRARRAILDQIKSENQTYIKIGRKMLEKRLESIGRKLTDKTLNFLMEEFDIFDKKPEELYFKVGCGAIIIDGLEGKLRKYYGINRESYFVDSKSNEKQKYVLASCCTPILGESVVGFRGPDGTITVHTRTCSNANNLAAKFGDQIVTVQWDNVSNSDSTYLARVSLKGTDRIGMINDITRMTAKQNVNIRRVNLGTEDGIFEGYIDLYVHDIKDLENLIHRLKEIEGIETVAKTEL